MLKLLRAEKVTCALLIESERRWCLWETTVSYRPSCVVCVQWWIGRHLRLNTHSQLWLHKNTPNKLSFSSLYEGNSLHCLLKLIKNCSRDIRHWLSSSHDQINWLKSHYGYNNIIFERSSGKCRRTGAFKTISIRMKENLCDWFLQLLMSQTQSVIKHC